MRGLLDYVTATGDQALMIDHGAEILFETSRFWTDRLEPRPDGKYVLTRVVGPDEFHEHVDNNAYTNYLVRWHLRQAAHVYAELSVTHPDELADLAHRIGLTSRKSRNGSIRPNGSSYPATPRTG